MTTVKNLKHCIQQRQVVVQLSHSLIILFIGYIFSLKSNSQEIVEGTTATVIYNTSINIMILHIICKM